MGSERGMYCTYHIQSTACWKVWVSMVKQNRGPRRKVGGDQSKLNGARETLGFFSLER